MVNFQKVSFLSSAPKLSLCPPDEGIEIAFAGRSNAGKSTALNTLVKNRKLAKTSKTPGRTQLINFFELNEKQRLVDLPGYGYAKVPLSVKRKWDINLSEYLRFRQSLRGLILLMDSRHPLTEYDRQILMWSSQTNLEVHILLTKADKQKNNALKTTLEKVKNFTLDPELSLPSISVQLFSSKSKLGLKEFEEKINSWFTRELLNPQ